jgi:CrcB protein
MYLNQLMIVGAGGFIGSVLRFMVGGWVQRLAVAGLFPYGTLVVNVLGCLLIGFLGGLAEYRQLAKAIANTSLQVVLGFAAAFAGFVGARYI